MNGHVSGVEEEAGRDGEHRPPRRRRPRRATRAGTAVATAGAGTADGAAQPTADDTDAGWGERVDEVAHERWLTEQRPPHWG